MHAGSNAKQLYKEKEIEQVAVTKYNYKTGNNTKAYPLFWWWNSSLASIHKETSSYQNWLEPPSLESTMARRAIELAPGLQ